MKRKHDLILICGLLVLAALLYMGMEWYGSRTTKTAEVVVSVDGTETARFWLSQDREWRIDSADGFNTLVIKNGEASVTEASCPDGICVEHRRISKNGESIVCLPNKVIVTIENGEEAEVDMSSH